MKMVAASKLKRSKDAHSRTQPYILQLTEALSRLSSSEENISHPLFEVREINHTRYIVFTSDRGLCGGFNNNLIKFLLKELKNNQADYDLSIIGKRAYNICKKRGLSIHHYYEEAAVQPGFPVAQKISRDVIFDFSLHKTDRVMTQRPHQLQLLPYKRPVQTPQDSEAVLQTDYLFEPDKESLIRELVPKQIAIRVFQILLENAVGEHAARMTAMESATNNAMELISTLTVQMNRARQAAITTELTEIISGAEAL
jgi:F-type H+-transporting ATPase subunit gamma